MQNKLNRKVLILGSLPPPIGGVTIHVSRLLRVLDVEGILYDFKKLSILVLLLLPFYISKYSMLHLHSSHAYVRLYVGFLSRVFKTRYIVTFHGNLGRHRSPLKNKVDNITIKIASVPIVLNKSSYEFAVKLNKRVEIVSAFIPPDLEREYLQVEDLNRINTARSKYEWLFCTNAYNFTLDKDDQEIYGIFELIEVFRNSPKLALIFSDPSGAYSREFVKRNTLLPDNFYIITGLHSFYKVMQLCDGTIRNTTTDGDSLSVKESLYLNKLTFATNVVSRPPGTQIYDKQDLFILLNNLKRNNTTELFNNIYDGSERLMELYRSKPF